MRTFFRKISNLFAAVVAGLKRTGKNRAGLKYRPSRKQAAIALSVAAFLGQSLLVSILPVRATTLSNGMNARYVLGQANFTSLAATASASGMSNPRATAYDAVHNRLFVADKANNRVLVFNGTDKFNGQAAANVLGQADFTSAATATSQTGMRNPSGLAYDSVNQRLFVADLGNNRVLVFNVATITNGQAAVNVLGQPNFTSSAVTFTQTSMASVTDVVYDAANQRLFVASLRRVLVFDVSTITDGQAAVHVIGQPNFTSIGTSVTQSGLSNPEGAAYDPANQRLFVSDLVQNRVLIFNVSTITNGMNATNVLGQTDFTSNAAATSASGLQFPVGLTYDTANKRLFVNDSGNQRILVYDANSFTNGEVAVNVLGQPGFSTATGGTSQSQLNSPFGLLYEPTSQRLFVGDEANNRILVYAIGPDADLSLTDTVNNTTPNVGASVTFTLTATNSGAATATGVSVKDLLPAGLTYASSSPSQGSYDSSTGTWTIGTIASGASKTLTITASVNSGTAGTAITNTAQVLLSDQNDPDSIPNNSNAAEDDQASATLSVQLADLSLTDTVNNAAPAVGSTVTYTLTVFDGGSSSTATNVAVKDALPAGLTFVSATPSQGSYVSGTGIWTIGSIAPGASKTLTISATVNANVGGQTITNTAQVSASDQVDPDSTPNNSVAGEDDQASAVINVPLTTLTNGMNATNVLGQALFTGGAGDTTKAGMRGARGSAYDAINNRLFVADFLNNRVLVYNGSNITNGQSAVNVLGQPNFATSTANTTQTGMSGPISVTYDSDHNRLFVTDRANNRVLVFDVAAITDGEAAVNVLGQSLFTTATGATTQSGMAGPNGTTYDAANQRLFVPEIDNNRVLVFDVTAITNGENAINVLGQSLFTTNGTGVTQTSLTSPRGAAYDAINNRLFVADFTNNRVVVYDVASITNGETGINVLGQPNFTANTPATTQSVMNNPTYVAYDEANQRLFVNEYTNHRVLVYNVATITNGMNATNVLGQPNFSTATGTTTQSGMSNPYGVDYDATRQRLFVSDYGNSRVLVYNLLASTDLSLTNTVDNASAGVGASATFTLTVTNGGGLAATGVSVKDLLPAGLTYVSSAPSQGGYVSSTGIWTVGAIASGGTANLTIIASVNAGTIGTTITDTAQVSASDQADPDSTPNNDVASEDDQASAAITPNVLSDGMNATNVLGQVDFTSATAAKTQSGMSDPGGVAFDPTNKRIFVADQDNNRVLVYAGTSITNGQPAVNVLGQSNFTSFTGATTQSGMRTPVGVTYDSTNQRLFVSDYNNARVLVYDVAAITNGEPAVNVLGQPDFTSSASATTQSGMSNPAATAYDATRQLLFQADANISRVLVFDVNSITNGENAVNVIGQPNFTTKTITASRNGMSSARGIAYDAAHQRLFVGDLSNSRVTVYDVATITDGMNASNVLGQPNFTVKSTVTTQAGLNLPFGVTYDAANQRLFVLDLTNNRVVVYDVNSITDGENAINVLGQPNFTSSAPATTRTGMRSGFGVTFDTASQRLFVADRQNHRVLVFDLSPSADLSLTKTVDNATPNIGGSVTYTVTVANAGPSSAAGVAVSDVLPTGLTLTSATSTQGTFSNGTHLWTVGTLASGASKTLTLVASVNTGTSGTTITNTAEVSASGVSDSDSTPGNGAAGEDDQASVNIVPQSADLSLTKTVSDATPNVGSSVTYTVTLSNAGPSATTGVAVLDQLPSGVTFISSTTSQGTYVSGTGVWTVGSLSNGASANMTISATVNAGTAGTTITNTAQVSASDAGDTDSTPNNDAAGEDDQASVNVVPQSADLSLTKSVNNATPGAGANVIYTVTVTNGGPSAASGVSVKDLLPAGMTFVSATPSQGSYASATGTWTVGAIANGASKTLVITATVDAGSAGTSLTNTAQVMAADQEDPDSTPNNSQAGEDDQASAGIAVAASPTIQFHATTSSGSEATTPVHLQIDLSAASALDATVNYAVTGGSATGGGTDFTLASGTATVTAGATNTNITMTVNDDSADESDETVVITLTSPSGTTLGANSAHTYTILDNDVAATADLSLFVSSNVSSPAAGDAVTFTVTLTNDGPANATGVAVKDLLPTNVTFVSATASQGSYASGSGIWTVGSVASGATKTLAIHVTVDAGVTGVSITDTAEVSAADQEDSDSTPDNHVDGEDDQASVAVIVPALEEEATLFNHVRLARTKIGVATTLGIDFTLQSPLDGTLTVTLPEEFTVVSAFTSGTCSGGGTINTFAFDNQAHVITAEKHGCSGHVRLNGAAVETPDVAGSYTISWVNDAPGEGDVEILPSESTTTAAAIRDIPTREAINVASTHDLSMNLPLGGIGTGETMTLTYDGFDTDFAASPTIVVGCGAGSATGAVSGRVLTITGGATPCTGTLFAYGYGGTNPSSAGLHDIDFGGTSGVLGALAEPIVDSDQVNVSAAVMPSISFDIDLQSSSNALPDATESAAPYVVDLGTISTADTRVSGTTDGIAYIMLDLSSNASAGAVVTVKSLNGANGLVSTSLPADDINSSDGTVGDGLENYGLCSVDADQVAGGPIAATAGLFSVSCAGDTEGNSVLGFDGTPQVIYSSPGPVAFARMMMAIQASISNATSSHNDYTDTLTFIATGTF